MTDLGAHRVSHRSKQRLQDLIEDTEFLLSWGCSPEHITARLGYRTIQALARRLSRYGRSDLSRRLTGFYTEERTQRP